MASGACTDACAPCAAAASAGVLLAPEPRTRLYAAFFWQCASAWEEFAEALAKSIFAVTAVRDA
eukprot:3799108-Prymnesium_polylepis.1